MAKNSQLPLADSLLSSHPNFFPYQALTLLGYNAHKAISRGLQLPNNQEWPFFLGLTELFKILNLKDALET